MRKPFLALTMALALVATACGQSATPDTTTTQAQAATTTTVATTTTTTTAPTTTTTDPGPFPITVTVPNGEVTLEGRPTRIVSLSPTATEMLFAVGAGDQVIAADEYSTYPEEAPDTDLSGFTPNTEAILAFDPDLVLVANDIDDIVAALEGVGVPVVLLPAAVTFEDVYHQIEVVGLLTGHLEDAVLVTEEMQDEIESLVSGAPQFEEPLTYFHELDPTYYSVTSTTFIGQVYSLFGLENIADPADESGFGYPQLSEEYIIEADPNLIFLADAECCDVTAESVAARPGWSEVSAVQNGYIFAVDADIASRWGPRIVEYIRTVASALSEVETG